jgi:hypothetical protein
MVQFNYYIELGNYNILLPPFNLRYYCFFKIFVVHSIILHGVMKVCVLTMSFQCCRLHKTKLD